MVFSHRRRFLFSLPLTLVGILFVSSLARSSAAFVLHNAVFVSVVRVIEADETGVTNPTALVFSHGKSSFHVVSGGVQGQRAEETLDVVKLSSFGDQTSVVQISAMASDPMNITFDSRFNRLLFIGASMNQLTEVLEGADGELNPATLTSHNVHHFGLQNPQGMTVDPTSGDLFILDTMGPRLIRVEPAVDGAFGEARVSSVDLQPTGLVAVRGLAFDSRTGHLHLLSIGEHKLVELTQTGEIIAMRDLSEFEFRNPRGMVFAPSSDLTDHPSEINLFIIDGPPPDLWGAGRTEAGLHRETEPETTASLQFHIFLPVVTNATGGSESLFVSPDILEASGAVTAPGMILELSFTEPPSSPSPASQLPLVQTIDTSQFSPPSPDPSGLAYLPHLGTLLIADGEVDEMPQYFTGDNLFEMSLSGDLVKTLTTISFTDEPVGLDVNPLNHHLFIGDDAGIKTIYEVNPGSDGQYDTADDIVTSFSTAAFDSKDPEGLAYDPGGAGTLYILDGVNREVYRVSPGANGLFDGVAPTGDDQVTHFDTLSFGLDDPEGIAFNPYTGNLYAVGKPKGVLFEFTTGGVLVQTLDISVVNARKPAGLAIAPGSQNAGQASIYLVDRGVDNDSDPNENDGKVYEFSLGQPVQTPASTPTDTSTPTGTPVPPAATPTDTPTDTPAPTDTTIPLAATPTDTPATLPTLADTPMDTPTVAPIDTPIPPTATPVQANSGDESKIHLPLILNHMGESETVSPSADAISLMFAAVADARVMQANPSTNYGASSKLSADLPDEQSYIRFAVSGVNGAVQSAVLRLFVTNGSSNGPSLRAADNSWSESGITWNNRPAATGGVIADVGAIAADSWAEYNVTAQVTGDGVYNFVLLPDGTDGASFESREGDVPPQLVLSFFAGPTPTSTHTPTSTDTPVPSTTTPVLPTATPTATPFPSTATPTVTSTPVLPTATPTATPFPSTATPTVTSTPVLPTATPTTTSAVVGLTLAAVADARVMQSNPATNYGASSKLSTDLPGEQSYIRFDGSGVSGAVQSAVLRLFATNGSTDGPEIYRTDNSWSENGITWNNRPPATGSLIADSGAIGADNWVEYDVTALVTGSGIYNFVLVADSSDGASFKSREGNAAPQLVLSFTAGPTPTPTVTPTPGPSPTPTNTPSTASAVLVGAGDIASCSRTQDEATALLLDSIPGTVFTIGDNAYPNGSAADFNNCYGPTWGRHKDRTRPAVGDNEYGTSGAAGYFNYFGAAAGDPTKGYYSYDVGSWHIIVLNSNCSRVGGCGPTSPQGQWLQSDLAANPKTCTLAIFHEPLFSSSRGDTDMRDFWTPLYAAGADIVLGGHRHNYERFAPQNPNGQADPGRGIRAFVVGTGGASLSSLDTIAPNSEVRNNTTHGVLKLTLHPTSYDWEFIPIAGQTFTDSGSALCVTP